MIIKIKYIDDFHYKWQNTIHHIIVMSEKEYWRDYSYVMRGQQRKKVLLILDGPALVSEIKGKTNLSLAETSRVLRGLVEQGLAECKNPEDHLGRVYGLTDKGYNLQKKIK